MRITFVLPRDGMTGGVRVVAVLADRLRKRGHDVVVVSLPRPSPSLKQRVRGLLRPGSWRSAARGSYFDGLAVEHRVLDRHRPIEARDLPDADALIATWWETAEWIAPLPASKGVKVHFVQGHEVFEPLPVERVEAVYRLPMPKITVSRWLVDILTDQYGATDVALAPNSVDTSQFHAPPRSRQAVPTVGMLYNRHPIKGHDVMARAIERVRGRIPNLRVIAFGTNEPTASAPLPEGAEFHLRPAQERIPELYAACDVWMAGSRSEGFCLPMLEAMACRCPVVSTRVGGPIDVIRDGENGFLVDIEDDRGLADRLVEVLELDPGRWKTMSDAAYATAIGYTWDDAAELFERALRQAVARPSGAGQTPPATRISA